jgi:hypothetical protein
MDDDARVDDVFVNPSFARLARACCFVLLAKFRRRCSALRALVGYYVSAASSAGFDGLNCHRTRCLAFSAVHQRVEKGVDRIGALRTGSAHAHLRKQEMLRWFVRSALTNANSSCSLSKSFMNEQLRPRSSLILQRLRYRIVCWRFLAFRDAIGLE